MQIHRTIASRALIVALLSVCTAAEAAYPDRPIRMIIAATAGSGPDILARQIGTKLTEAWGQQIVVDARPGATGVVGAEMVAKAAPDGYTLWFATMTQLIGTTMYQRYMMSKDFAPIGMVASTAFAIAVNAALGSTSTGNISLSAGTGGIALGADVTTDATKTLTLTTTGGGVSQTAGVITTGTLAGGAVEIGRAHV